MYKLKGKVQHYAWGGTQYIPELLGIANAENKPFAEYWMGAHTSSPALIEISADTQLPITELLADESEKILGKPTVDRFGGLPYLLKVLDVKDMLSIQVHPTKAEAAKGFARENEMGVPLDAPHRNYKDDNHKPEVMVALSEFWLLHGFKEKSLLLETLQEIEAFNFLISIFESEGYYGLYKQVMEMPQQRVDEVLAPVLQQALPLYKSNLLSKASPAYWACKTLNAAQPSFTNIDRGIFSIYFFNVLQLHPAQAIFQGAGVPHAYLEGQNIELMSNSDNVLRGGLTPKHIDVPELLKHTLFQGIVPAVMEGIKQGAETIYHCPVPDFVVSAIELEKDGSYEHVANSAEIILVVSGDVEIKNDLRSIHLQKGEAALMYNAESYAIKANTPATLYKAGVPA